MSSLHVALAPARSVSGAVLPHSRPRVSVLAASGVSSAVVQKNNADIEAVAGEVWFLTAVGADLLVACGPAPEAGVDPGHYLPAGIPMAFAVNSDGEKVAVIDA